MRSWEELKSKSELLLIKKKLQVRKCDIVDPSTKEHLLTIMSRPLKWKGFKIFADKEMTRELLYSKYETKRDKSKYNPNFDRVKNNFSLIYYISDSTTHDLLGAIHTKSTNTMFRYESEILSAEGMVIGKIYEKKGARAVLNKIFRPIKRIYLFEAQGQEIAKIESRFGVFRSKHNFTINNKETVDFRILIAAASLIVGVETINL